MCGAQGGRRRRPPAAGRGANHSNRHLPTAQRSLSFHGTEFPAGQRGHVGGAGSRGARLEAVLQLWDGEGAELRGQEAGGVDGTSRLRGGVVGRDARGHQVDERGRMHRHIEAARSRGARRGRSEGRGARRGPGAGAGRCRAGEARPKTGARVEAATVGRTAARFAAGLSAAPSSTCRFFSFFCGERRFRGRAREGGFQARDNKQTESTASAIVHRFRRLSAWIQALPRIPGARNRPPTRGSRASTQGRPYERSRNPTAPHVRF